MIKTLLNPNYSASFHFFFSPEVSAVQSMVVLFFFLFFRTEKSLTISTNSNSAQGREKLLEHMGVRTEVFSS